MGAPCYENGNHVSIYRLFNTNVVNGMHGSRKFCQRESNFDVVFLVDEGRDDPNTSFKRGIIGSPAKRHFWHFAGALMMAQH